MLILSGYRKIGDIIKANKELGDKFFVKNAVHSEVFARKLKDDSYKYYFVAKPIGKNYSKFVVYQSSDCGKITEVSKKARWSNLEEAINMAHMLGKVPA